MLPLLGLGFQKMKLSRIWGVFVKENKGGLGNLKHHAKKLLSLRADRHLLAVLPLTNVSLRDFVSNRGNPLNRIGVVISERKENSNAKMISGNLKDRITSGFAHS